MPIGSGKADTLEKKFELAAVDPVTLHNETHQGILHQLGKRALGDGHDILQLSGPPGSIHP